MHFDRKHTHFYQKTIKAPVVFEGIGLHSGEKSVLTLHPAPLETGIVFLKNDCLIPARYDSVVSTSYCVTLGKEGAQVRTVEHLLAALSFLGIDNLVCEISGPELPILDGSSAVFCEKIEKAGLENFTQPKKWAVVSKAVQVQVNASLGSLEPSAWPLVSVELEYDHPCLPLDTLRSQGSLLSTEIVTQIGRARTYGFEKDQALYAQYGLAQGASLENALIFGENRILNPEGSRYENEIARHKVLDCIGDLFLLGHFLWGHYKAIRPGHGLTVALIQELVKHSAFDFVSSEELVCCHVE